MTKNEIRQFLKRNCKKEIYVDFYNNIEDHAVALSFKTEIHVNYVRFCRNSEAMQKALLLHEIGHLQEKLDRRKSLREFDAHRWAYEAASKRKWTRIQSALIELASEWKTFGWNEFRGESRKYIIAARLFKNYLRRIRRKRTIRTHA